MNRAKRKIKALETIEILEQGYYINSKEEKIDISEIQNTALKGTKFRTPEVMNEILKRLTIGNVYKTSFEVVDETTIHSIQRLTSLGFFNPMCLNFASAKNPGGGFLSGSQAQEESIARSSGLYPCLSSVMEFYKMHRKLESSIHTDAMIYSPEVPIIRNDDGILLDTPIVSSIISAAAINVGAVDRLEFNRLPEVEGIMRTRIDKLLALSANNEHKTLILGAWGCGVFQNDPTMIARLFAELLKEKYRGVFEKVVFAIYAKNKKFIEAFQKEFENEITIKKI